MDRYDLALIGFGGVNRGLAELIVQRGDDLARELGFTLRVVAITDLRAGSLVDSNGIDLAPLLSAEPDALSFAGRAGGSADPRNEWVIRHVPADIVAEATYTNPTDGCRRGRNSRSNCSTTCLIGDRHHPRRRSAAACGGRLSSASARRCLKGRRSKAS